MSKASTSINDLEISARITRKLREAGFANMSQLTNSWLDPWADSLSAREAAEVVDALRTSSSSSHEVGKVSSNIGLSETFLDDGCDDVIFLSISTNLANKLRRLGYRKVSEIKKDLPRLVISASTKEKLVEAIRLWEAAARNTYRDDEYDDVIFLSISTNLANKLIGLGYRRVSEIKKDLPRLVISEGAKKKLRKAILLWGSAITRERAGILETSTAAMASPPKGEWFPSKPLNSFNTPAELIFQLFQEALSSFKPVNRRVLEARAFAGDQSDFPTLQTLAEEAGVTRERVRQIEKRGLTDCRALILENKPTKLLSPRPELQSFWQPILAGLAELEEISMEDLSNLIDATLEISSSDRSRVLGLLTPLLTLSVMDPLVQQSRAGTVNPLPAGLAALPVTHLRLGRATDSLIADEIHNIGAFWSSGHNKRYKLSKKNKAALDALQVIASNDAPMLQDPELSLSRALNVHVDDFVWRGSVAETYVDFIPWFSGVIGIILTWRKVEDVFRLRTALPAGERMSLKRLSLEISGNSNGSFSGRIERYILDEMTTIFVHKDLSKCPIHIPSEVNELMDSLTSCFSEVADNFELFSTIISHRLDIPESEVKKSSHLFWALLSGNLPNRYWHLKGRARGGPAAQIEDAVNGTRTIKLKGFRKRF
jgi:hypothetical protein